MIIQDVLLLDLDCSSCDGKHVDFMSVRNLAAISKRSDTKSWSLFGRTCRNNDHNDDSHVRNMEPRGRIEFLINVNRHYVSYVRVPNFQKIVIFMVQKSIHRLRRELIDAISIVKYRAGALLCFSS